MKKALTLCTYFALLLSPLPRAQSLYGTSPQQKESANWIFDENSNILKAIGDYLTTKNLEPLFQKGEITFNLDGFESNSGPENNAFPIGKISQNGKSYYAMFYVHKQETGEQAYYVKLLSLSTEKPPSIIFLQDILSSYKVLSAVDESLKFDYSNLLIEHLPPSKPPKVIYSKWTLFEGDKQAIFYVKSEADEKGETDFSVSKTPFKP